MSLLSFRFSEFSTSALLLVCFSGITDVKSSVRLCAASVGAKQTSPGCPAPRYTCTLGKVSSPKGAVIKVDYTKIAYDTCIYVIEELHLEKLNLP